MLLGSVCTFAVMRLQAAPWLESLLPTITFSVFFIVAATAIAFAGEVDDRTVNLLRMLPCSTATLMAAKLTAVVTGCLTLFGAMAALSGFIEVAGLAFPKIWRTEENNLPFDDVWFQGFAASMVLLFVTTIVASLVTKRVIYAVGLAAVIFLAILTISGYVWYGVGQQRPYSGPPFWWFLLTNVPVATIASILVRPWHYGRIPRDLHPLQTMFTRSSGRVSHLIPRWTSLLKRIVARPFSHGRAGKTLVWRECRSAIPFAILWLLAGTLICAGRCVVASHDYPWPGLFLLVFIHECGQRTMRADQRAGSISMLANMGVSPRSILLTKTATWLIVMIPVLMLIVVLDAFLPNRYTGNAFIGQELRILEAISQIRVPHVSGSTNITRDSTAVDLWLQASTSMAVVLLIFSVGQLTVCWIQRQILAFAASLFLLFAIGIWIRICIEQDYSIWISVMPIGLCFLLATLMTARQWIDGTTNWKLRVQQVAWVILPSVLFAAAGRCYWTLEPTYVVLQSIRYMYSDQEYLRNPQVRASLEPLNEAISFPTSQWQQLDVTPVAKIWQQFATQLAGSTELKRRLTPPVSGWLVGRDEELPTPGMQDEDRLGVAALLQIFDDHLAIKKEWPLLPVSWTAPWSNTPAPSIVFLLLADAAEREKMSDIPGSVRQHVRALQLTRALANQTASWKNWTACVRSEQAALDSLRQLLGSADLTHVDLNDVYGSLKELLIFSKNGRWQPLDPRPMLHRRYVFWSIVAWDADNALRNIRGESRDMDAFAGSMSTVSELQAQIESKGWSRLQRAMTTMQISDAILNSEFAIVPDGGRLGQSNVRGMNGMDDARASASRAVQRFAATSTIGDLNEDPAMLSDRLNPKVFPIIINITAEERATLLTVLLHRHRIQHGKFPDSLMDLDEGDPVFSFMVTDPWSGAPFFYASQGVSRPLRRGHQEEGFRVAAGQPILFSPGRFAYPLQHYMRGPAQNESTRFSTAILPPNLILFLGLDELAARYPFVLRVIEYKTTETSAPNAAAENSDHRDVEFPAAGFKMGITNE